MSLGTFPVQSPSASGQLLTVDQWLARPTVIQRRIADLTQKQFFADKIFNVGGSLTGGSVVTEIPNAVDNDLFTTTDVQRIEPLAAYPRAKTTRGTLTTFTPEKWGHEFEVSDEAREDNDTAVMNRAPQQLANTLVRKLHIRAVETLEAAATTYSRTKAAATTWTAINALTYDTKTNASTALAVIIAALEQIEGEERGFESSYDTLLVNPAQKAALITALGVNEWQAVLGAYGITNVFSSPRVTAGTAYFIASGQVGEMRFVQPLTVVPYREEDVDATILKAKARFVPFVNEPYAFLKLTGLA